MAEETLCIVKLLYVVFIYSERNSGIILRSVLGYQLEQPAPPAPCELEGIDTLHILPLVVITVAQAE